jgi:polysaccharide biosynthesis transport protein
VLNDFTARHAKEGGTPFTRPDSRVVSWASAPVDASSPKYGVILAVGMFAFAGLALIVTFAIERLRPGFDTIPELEEQLGLVAAGLTPLLRRGRALPGRLHDPVPMRELALRVRALSHTPVTGNASSRVVLVSSSVPGEGKSTVALSLARSVANSGQRCLLIDADVRDPSMHATLRVPAAPGLVDLTLDRSPSADALRALPEEGFDLLPAGRPPGDALSPFTIDAFGVLLGELKQQYDVIVIDSAPALLAAEVLVLAGRADLTLLLVKWRTTPREIALKTAQLLGRCSSGPCLAVLSQVDLHRMRAGAARGIEEQYRAAYRF